MSWLYSRALVEEYSADTSSDGGQSAQLSVICTQHQFSHRDKMTDISCLSQYGLTYAVLTADHGEDVLMSYLAGFPAKTSHQQEEEKASQEPAQDSGARWSESFARWDHDLSLWRTAQCSLLGDWELFSETWPRWGSMRNGVCWERATSEHRIKETGSGFLATPTKTANQLAPSMMKHPGCRKLRRDPRMGSSRSGGELNPKWIEWLMGWPMGWTDLEPLETDRFREWPHSHSSPSTTDS